MSKKGYKQSEKHKKKLSDSNKGKHSHLFGHIVSSETRNKIRNKLIGRKFGHIHSKAFKERARKRWLGENNPNFRGRLKERGAGFQKGNTINVGKPSGMLGKYHSERTKEKMRQKRLLQHFPFKDTSIEIKMQKALKEANIQFRTHEPIIGQPDIFIKPNLCIFCDGDYWHNYPDGRERDKYVNHLLEKKGYSILRFWEHEIENNIGNCINTIRMT